jgi:hypothetical protein
VAYVEHRVMGLCTRVLTGPGEGHDGVVGVDRMPDGKHVLIVIGTGDPRLKMTDAEAGALLDLLAAVVRRGN